MAPLNITHIRTIQRTVYWIFHHIRRISLNLEEPYIQVPMYLLCNIILIIIYQSNKFLFAKSYLALVHEANSYNNPLT
jgi:hypothetical protein